MSSLRDFYNRFPTVKIAKGDVVLHQSETPTVGYAIKRGVIRICNINASGDEKIISFKVTDEPLPVCWLFSKTTHALFFYQAHTDCELYVIKKEDFNAQLVKDLGFSAAILDIMANAYINANLQADALVQTRASIKLLYTFRHLGLRYGKDIEENRTRIQIPLTQQELANYTGLTRETTTIELNKLKAADVVFYKHKYYTINTQKINDMIEDEYNPGVKSDLQTLSKGFVL
jgi:CRP-like cAMP-binding protein